MITVEEQSKNIKTTAQKIYLGKQQQRRKKILLIGNDSETIYVANNINRIANNYCAIGRLLLSGRNLKSNFLEVPVLGELSEIELFMKLPQNKVDIIIIGDSEIRHHQILWLISLARQYNIELFVVPALAAVFHGYLKFCNFYGHPLIKINVPNLQPLKLILKTLFDYLTLTIGLILCSPIIVITAVLIKLISPGPVIYKQIRVGKNSKSFNLYKFRTMYVDAEQASGPVLSESNDERVTPLGRILRKTHIDELPQFFNVLNGTMSFVGPRPERSLFVKKFNRHISFYSDRFSVKPGITGLAQIYGSYFSKAAEKLIFDLNYIHNYTLWLDLKICVLTVWAAIKNLFTD